jgi:Rieske Fe-S protein
MALTDIDLKKAADLDTPDTDPTISRRRFLQWGIYAVGAGITAVLAVPAIGYFIAPATTSTGSLQTAVGKVSDFTQTGAPKSVNINYDYLDEFKKVSGTATVFVAALKANPSTAGDFRVLSNICTHLGCAVNYDTTDKQFHCPCHGSVYAENGDVVHGPAIKSLNKFDVTVQNGQLMINPLQSFA